MLMAALLSATAEKNPAAWDLNMNSLFHVLNLAKGKIKNILAIEYCRFWSYNPKKIRHNTPSWSRLPYMESVNKRAKDGAVLLISLASMYEASDIQVNQRSSPPGWWNYRLCCGYFHKALADKKTTSLFHETKMPMMYMDDAIAATIKLCKLQLNK
jgi:hypothetical protein